MLLTLGDLRAAGASLTVSVPDDTPVVGQLGPYDVLDVRSGGHGDVYICRAPSSQGSMAFAMKSFTSSVATNPQYRRAFQRECAINIRLSRLPGFLPTLGMRQIGGRPYLAMLAAFPGPRGTVNLAEFGRQGALDIATTIFVAWAMAESLATAHDILPGVVHGDLKPENVLLIEGVPFVVDFGLGAVADQASPDGQC